MKKCFAPPVVVRHFTVHNAPFAKVSAIHSAKAPFGVCHRFAPCGFSKQALCKVPFRGQGLCRSFRALRPLRVLPVRSSHATSFGAPPSFFSQSASRCSVGSSAPPTPQRLALRAFAAALAWAYPSAPKGLPYTQAIAILRRMVGAPPLRPLRGRGYRLAWRSTPPFFEQMVPHSLWSVKAKPCGLRNRYRWSPFCAT